MNLEIETIETAVSPERLTVEFLRANIGKEFTYHFHNDHKNVFTMSEFMVSAYEDRPHTIQYLTPNF